MLRKTEFARALELLLNGSIIRNNAGDIMTAFYAMDPGHSKGSL